MAGIDYTIPGQFKGIQLESPMNAMAQAMQLRNLQETSQMNALRAQEYELKTQDAREMSQQRNALAQYLANPKRPTDALELEAGVRQVAPLLADQFVDTQLKRADLGIRTKEHEAKTFEIRTKEEERKRAMSKEQFQEAVSDLVSYDTVDHVLAALEQKLNAGQITQAQKDQVIAGLPNNDSEIPAWQIRTVRGMLTPKERVEDIRAEAKLLRDEAAAKEKQRKAEQKQAYSDYVFDATEKGEEPMTEAEFVASLNQQPATAAATPRVTPAAASTTAAPTTVATTAPDGTKELPGVEMVAGTYGVHPQARAFYRAGNKIMGDAIQAAHVAEKKRVAEETQKRIEAERKSKELPGDFQGVFLAEQKIIELEKNPTPENKRLISVLKAQIKAANLGKGTNVNVGVKMPEGVKAVDQKYAQDYLDWTQGGGADAAANAAQIKSVLDRFANGEVLSGPSIGMAPDFFNALVNPEALNAKQQIEEVVQRNLRAVLGAQFTQVEGERLISRAFDARLKPQENAKRLRKLFMQIQTAAQQKQAMAEYYEKNETLRGFKGKAPNMNDFFNVLNAPDAPPKGSVDVMVDGKMQRFKSQADFEAYKAKGGKVDK